MYFCIAVKGDRVVGYYGKSQETVLHRCSTDGGVSKDLFYNENLTLTGFGQLLDSINKEIKNIELQNKRLSTASRQK